MRHLSLSVILTAASFAYAGAAYTPPCTLAVDNEQQFETQWVTVDANGDGSPYLFRFGGDAAYYTQNKGKAANDWVISPAVTLTAGVTYNIVATVQNLTTYSSDKDKFKVCTGTAQTTEGMTNTIFSVENLYKSSTPEEKNGKFTPTVSGDYYFGLHLYSDSYNGDFKLMGFRIEALASIPAAVSDLMSVPAPEGALQADLSWTWPTADTFGGTLTSISGADIYRGTSASFAADEASKIGSVSAGAEPGGKGSFADTQVPSSGEYYYKVVPFNENGVSTSTPASAGPIWIGPDRSLKAVTGLTASADETASSISLTWNAPEGTNGGYVDLSKVVYNITRSKDGAAAVTIAEGWNGQLPYVDSSLQGLGSYTYTVRTVYDGSAGFSSATSNAVIAGGTMPLPYANTFDSQQSVELFTFFNGPDATRGWTYSSSKKALDYWGGSTADAWAALPVFALEAGKTYRLAFSAYVSRAASPKNLSIAFGSEPTAAALTGEIFSEQIANTLGGARGLTFSVPADGNYYIAFHCFGASDSNDLYVDDLSLEAVETTPLPVEAASAEAAPAGALKAIVKWTNPSKDTAGNPLQGISKVSVSLDGKEAGSVANPAPGAESSVEIAVAEPGRYTFSITAFSDEAASPAVEVQTPWVGFDTPLAPESVTVTVGDNERTVSFEPVTAGVNGGYVDTAELRYIVSRNDDVLTTDLDTPPYVDAEGDLPLAVYTYSVKAINGDFTGEAASAAPVVLGDALQLPYQPNFADAETFALWTLTNGWKYDSSAKTLKTSASDSWAFTPPMIMKKGTCAVSFRATCYNYRNQEDMKVYLVKTTDLPIPADALLVAEHHVESVSFPDLTTNTFTVDETGRYYLAFGLDKTNWTLSLTEAEVKQLTEEDEPDGVDFSTAEGSLSYSADADALIVGRSGRLCVFGMQGASVMAADAECGTVSVGALAPGAYIAVLTDADGRRFTIKFIR